MAPDPSQLHVVWYPAPVLRRRAEPIAHVTEEVRAVAARMIELMRLEEGIGLAAPQVGLPWRLFVCDIPGDSENGLSASADPPTATHGPVVYINPVLSHASGPVEKHEEGCLSLPDIRGDVLRPPTITISATGLDGAVFTQTATGLLARCWQHEVDHLDGVLIIDRMSQMHRLKNRGAVRRLEREYTP